MLFLLEEAAVEIVAIAATLIAAGLLVMVLVGFALEERARRTLASPRVIVRHSQTSTFTPSRN